MYIIVNTVSNWFIKLHRQYDYLLVEENVYKYMFIVNTIMRYVINLY